MLSTSINDTLALVTAPKPASVQRGAEIKRRQEAAGVKVAKLTRLARLGSRTTTYAAFSGEASEETFLALEDALAFIEENPGDLDEQPGVVLQGTEHLVEFEVNVDAIGVRVVVRGPVENASQLQADVSKLIRDMKRDLPESAQD